jgi:hypothetical protein
LRARHRAKPSPVARSSSDALSDIHGSPLEKTPATAARIDGDFAFVAGTTGYDYHHGYPGDVTSQE